jgi:ribonuclease Z
MEKFSPSTHQLVINESNSCMGSVAVHRIQHKLHLLHQGIFPLLQDKSIPLEDPMRSENNGVRSMLEHGEEEDKGGVSCNLENSEEKHALINVYSNKMAERTVTSHKTISDIFSLIQARTFCGIHLRPLRGVDR